MIVLGAPELTGLPFSEERIRRRELLGVESPRRSDTSLGGRKLRKGLLAPEKSLGGLMRKFRVPRLEASESEWSPLMSLNLFRRKCGFLEFLDSSLRLFRPFLEEISWPLLVLTSPLWPVAHLPHPLGKYLLGKGGAHIFLSPQNEFFFPVSLPHLNLDLLPANSFDMYSVSILLALKRGLGPLPCRYFRFFFKNGIIDVARSWNFWFLMRIKLKITRWTASTKDRSNCRTVSSCLPLQRVHTNSKNLKKNHKIYVPLHCTDNSKVKKNRRWGV